MSWSQKIPVALGFGVLMLGALVGVVFLSEETGFLPRAAPEYQPKMVEITNVGESTFSVSWMTQEATVGFIKLGNEAGNLSRTITDDRDQLTGSSGQYRTHYVTVKGLEPSRNYYFKVGTQGNSLYGTEEEQAYLVTTGPKLMAEKVSETAYGRVLTQVETPAEGAVVYLYLTGAAPVSALVKQNGQWVINLALIRKADLSGFVSYEAGTNQELVIRYGLDDLAQVTLPAGEIQPAPTVILGKNDTVTEPWSAAFPEESEGSELGGGPVILTGEEALSKLTIVVPHSDGAQISQSQPEFSGTAPANVGLTLVLHSDTVQTGTVGASKDGRWSWKPQKDLVPGNYSLTVSYAEGDETIYRLVRRFVVAPMNDQVLGQTDSETSGEIIKTLPKFLPAPIGILVQEAVKWMGLNKP